MPTADELRQAIATNRQTLHDALVAAGPLPKTIHGGIVLTAWHLNDHANQIAEMP